MTSSITADRVPLLVGGSATLAGVIGILLAGTFLGGIAVAVLRPHAARHENTEITKEITR